MGYRRPPSITGENVRRKDILDALCQKALGIGNCAVKPLLAEAIGKTEVLKFGLD